MPGRDVSRTPRTDQPKPSGKSPPAGTLQPPPKLSSFRKEGTDTSNHEILSAINSLREEFSSRMDALEERMLAKVSAEMADIEQRVFDRCQASTSHSIETYHEKVTSKLSAKLDRIMHEKDEDLAKLTAVIHGIPPSTDRSQLDKVLKSVNVAYKALRVFTTKGGKTMGMLTFPSTKIRDEYITKFRSSERLVDDGDMKHTLGISPGKTKLQRDRNTSLRMKCDDLMKSRAPGNEYTIDWMKRTILLNGTPKYKQQRLSTEIVEFTKQ